jgi:hypothetical protein
MARLWQICGIRAEAKSTRNQEWREVRYRMLSAGMSGKIYSSLECIFFFFSNDLYFAIVRTSFPPISVCCGCKSITADSNLFTHITLHRVEKYLSLCFAEYLQYHEMEVMILMRRTFFCCVNVWTLRCFWSEQRSLILAWRKVDVTAYRQKQERNSANKLLM